MGRGHGLGVRVPLIAAQWPICGPARALIEAAPIAFSTRIFTMPARENPIGLDGFEFVEFTSPDSDAMADMFARLGFTHVGTHRTKAIRHYCQGDIHFLLNMEPNGHAAAFRAAHGPSASAMAFRVKDADEALTRAVERGATATTGDLDLPVLEGIGGSYLYLVDRPAAEALYARDFETVAECGPGAGLHTLDHLTHNVNRGRMDHWAKFYETVFNFRQIRYFDIEGQKTGLLSRAMTAPDDKIRIRNMAAKASSIWPSPPTTSSRPSMRSARAASPSRTAPTPITT